MLDEVRRYTKRADTRGERGRSPSSSCASGGTCLLHNQNALFVKRLFLFEERAVLTSVPFVLAPHREKAPAAAERA